MPKRKKPEPTPMPPPSGQDTDRYRIERYGRSRHFALYDGQELLAVTVYRKGAEAVRERLETYERTLTTYQSQHEALPVAADPPLSPSVAHPFEQSAARAPPQQLAFIGANPTKVRKVS